MAKIEPRSRVPSQIWLQKYAYPMVVFAVVILVWEAVVRLLGIAEYVLPAPSVIVDELFQQYETILRHSVVTTWEIILGFILSIIVGIPLGVAIHYSRFLERVFYPFLVASQTIPKIAIAPLLVIWFGYGLAPKVLIAFLIAFFPIVIDTVVGLRRTEEDMINLARSMGASRLQTFRKISLPNALPSIFGGFKVAVTLAVVGAVVGEFLAADQGLGYMLVVANGYLDTPLVFAGIISLSLLGILLFFVVEFLERILIPWETTEEEVARQSM